MYQIKYETKCKGFNMFHTSSIPSFPLTLPPSPPPPTNGNLTNLTYQSTHCGVQLPTLA